VDRRRGEGEIEKISNLPFSPSPVKSLLIDRPVVDRLYREANGARWGLPLDVFATTIEAGVARAFSDREASPRELDRYLASLHVSDLALACACALGHEGAWDHFVREHRPVLYRAADAIDPTGGARELADSLYADLYGLADETGNRRSLFRYFHGRSSLATWLRAVLAQRHVDGVRSRRRTEPLPDDPQTIAAPEPSMPPDPDRPRLLSLTHAALGAAIAALAPKDRLRLRSYYLAQLTLAQIGRITGEHEATVSRHLARTRRQLRELATRQLRDQLHLSDAEIDRAFELTLEDPGGLDLRNAFDDSAVRNGRAQESGP
jgi:RNA polymerase sigma-70 factor